MNVVAPLPPADLAQVQARLASVEAQNQTLRQELQNLRTENQLLRDKIQALLRRYFGSPKNESLDPAQLQLLLSGLVPLVPAPAPQPPATPTGSTRTSANRQPARSGIPENLPIVREVLLPEEVKANPEAFRQIEEVITKELDWESAKFYWRHIVRPKFVRQEPASAATPSATPLPQAPLPTPSQQKATAVGKELAAAVIVDPPEVFIAALPARLIEKGLPGVGLLVHLLLSRFEDHLPFYRLEKIFRERHGVPIARQSMVDWTEQLATWLQPVYRAMKAESFAGGYLQGDETPMRYLDRDEPGRSCQGYLFAYGHPRGNVLFEWRTSRGRDGPEEFLKDFKGKLQTDGYAAYSSLVRERNAPLLAQGKEPELILFACWAHARRKFIEAKDHDRRTAWFLKQIGLLYAVEKRLRQAQAGPRLRAAVRAAEAGMILARIKKALDRIGPQVLPQSLLGKAISYTLDLWPELIRYVEHGEVEIDSNQIENAIRPTALGKKNFLFIGHPDAGWRSAVIYSIMGSCRRYRIDPAKYLKDVLTRLPRLKNRDIPSLTPREWAKAHPEARTLPPK